MQKKDRSKKLTLDRETLRQLDDHRLQPVAGGTTNVGCLPPTRFGCPITADPALPTTTINFTRLC